MKEQFRIFSQLRDTTIPVPKARWLETDETVIGRPFYIMDYIKGWIPGAHPTYSVARPIYDGTPEFRSKIWWEAVDILAKVHTLDWKRAGFDFLALPKGGTDPIARFIAHYEKMLRLSVDSPPAVLESTTEWLKKNRFEPKHVSLCWGDAKLGNLIYSGDEVVGLLDWEMALLGDPESDLAWFIHMDLNQQNLLGKADGRLEGLPEKEETIAYYEKATQRKVKNFFYHDVFAIWRVAVISLRLQVVLKAIGYPLPEIDINRYNFERLRSLLDL